MTTCVIYCRISKDRQGGGLAVDRQEGECRELAARLGYTVVGVYVDNDLSAYTGKRRPEYRRLLEDITAGRTDVVIAWHTDRLHRSPVELEEYIGACEARYVATHTVKAGAVDLSTPSGRMVARQLGAVARYEVDHLSERVSSALRARATAGKYGGGMRPYGYESDGVTVRPDEAAVLRGEAEELAAGASLARRVVSLRERGMMTAQGKQWTRINLRRTLLRPRYAGLREHRGQIIGKAEWSAIIPESLWWAVRAVLTDPERRTTPGATRRWLLSGIAQCGVCDAGVVVVRPGGGRPSYACRERKCVVRNAEELDNYINTVVVERVRRPDLRRAVLEMRATGPSIDLAALSVEEDGLRARLDVLADDLALDERVLQRRTEALTRRLDEILATKASATRVPSLRGLLDAPDPGAAYLALDDLERRQELIKTLGLKIVIQKTKPGRPNGWRPGESYFDPESIDIS